MGLQACFGPPLLLALDEFLTTFSASTFKNDWLPGILRRLRLLRLPLPQHSSAQATPLLPLSTTAKPSKTLRAARRACRFPLTLELPPVPTSSPSTPPGEVLSPAPEPPLVRPLPPPRVTLLSQGARNARYIQERHERAFGFARGLPAKF